MNLSKLIKRLFNPLENAYHVGILEEANLRFPVKERYSKIKWIRDKEQSKTCWFADPFIYAVTESEITFFVEEYVNAKSKGIISKLVVDRNEMSIMEKHTLLELPSHLSFPIFFKENGKTFVYPENYQGGKVKIYEYDKTTDSLKYLNDIINDPLMDTQITKIEDIYYAFGVKHVTGNQNDTKELRIYKSDSLTGKYQYIHSIFNEKAEERGAGFIFVDKQNRLIRPAQSCENGYGKHIVLYQMILENGHFTEKVIERVLPDAKAKYGNVFHTFNCMNGIIAIDGWSFYHPIIARLYMKFKKIE